MARTILQDMIKRKSPGTSEVKIPVKKVVPPPPPPTPVAPPPRAPAPKEFIQKEKVVVPERVKEEPKSSGLDTDFASVYEMHRDDVGSGKSRYALWLVAGVSVIFLLFALSFLFSAAKITINPKTKSLALDYNFSAVKSGVNSDLPFDIVVIPGEESKTVPAGVERDVSIKATGKAIVYNTYGTSPQPLAIDTRLEGSNGKMYKTLTKLTVPGMKNGVPGSIEVSIYATEAGDSYNSTPLDFKIFGFKGTPKYTKFYARSKGNITGGFEGRSSDISAEEKVKVSEDLKMALREKLFNKALSQIPSGFVLWKDGSMLSTEESTFTPTTGGISADLKGTFSGFLFEENKLTERVAKTVLPAEEASGVYISNLRGLSFKLTSGDSSPEITNISFDLSGNVNLVWKIDKDKIVKDVLGQPKKLFNQILSNYPNVSSADLVIRPFWKTSFPEKSKDIQVLVNYPK